MSQQPRPNIDRPRLSQHHRQKQKEVRSGRIQKSKSKESLTTIPSAVPSLTSGRSTNRRRSALGPVSSRLEVPQPDSQHDGGLGLEAADDSMDSHDGEYEDNGSHGGESEEADFVELDADDEEQVADFGAQRPITWQESESEPSIRLLTVTPTPRAERIRYSGGPGRKTSGLLRVSQNHFAHTLPTESPAGSNLPATQTPTPNHSRPTTPEFDQAVPAVTSSRRNTAVGIELIIQIKARELMWDWTLFTDPFPDPITLIETVRTCWNDARRELGFSNFVDATPASNDQVSFQQIDNLHLICMTKFNGRRPLISQIRAKHSGCRSQYLHCAKGAIKELYKLDTEDPTACAQRVEYLLEKDRFNCPPNKYEVYSSQFLAIIPDRRKTKSNNADRNVLLDS
jgi:hypothetical protein